MRVEVLASAVAVARRVAGILGATVAREPEAVVGWPTGRTAVPLYDELARRHAARELDLSRVRGFNLDELLLPADDARSFAAYMVRHAWERIGLDRSRCEIPRYAAETAAECARYDDAIAAAGGLDLALLGVGEDGHVAYNLPGPPQSGTHVVTLPDAVAERLAVPAEQRPVRAITMGLGPIRAAAHVVLMATGSAKRAAVGALLAEAGAASWPCSLLAAHPNLDVILDLAAAGRTGGSHAAERRSRS